MLIRLRVRRRRESQKFVGVVVVEDDDDDDNDAIAPWQREMLQQQTVANGCDFDVTENLSSYGPRSNNPLFAADRDTE